MIKLLLISCMSLSLSAHMWQEQIIPGVIIIRCDSDILTDKGFAERMHYYELRHEEALESQHIFDQYR
jgi:hypothetical protein